MVRNFLFFFQLQTLHLIQNYNDSALSKVYYHHVQGVNNWELRKKQEKR